jgi:hypothetical protein
MTVARDYVEIGTGRLPDGSRKPNTLAYLSVYLQECTNTETAVLEVLDAFAGWNVIAPPFSFVLDAIGLFLGQPRPSGFSNEDYRNVLIARSIARVSQSQRDDIVKLAAFLATLNGGLGIYAVTGGPPEHWNITLFDVSLTTQWRAVYTTLITDAIGVTDGFTLTTATAASALYDSAQYDVSLYSP